MTENKEFNFDDARMAYRCDDDAKLKLYFRDDVHQSFTDHVEWFVALLNRLEGFVNLYNRTTDEQYPLRVVVLNFPQFVAQTPNDLLVRIFELIEITGVKLKLIKKTGVNENTLILEEVVHNGN